MRYLQSMQNNPPPLPENDDDKWFKQHSKLPGSGKAPHKQLQPKTLKKKAQAPGTLALWEIR